ncbi:MAG TPA: cobalt-precorrin-5B (C(1))-methyltransferase, partial [Anaeromyxobacteraceae bacterium]|nr:cobalt-precorrin-5B (C(1))-methyltransferase [Anaeromyxobacteraceae bacterium]
TGYTTGACAAAAARAACRAAVSGKPSRQVTVTLPNGQPATFAVARCEPSAGAARCGVVKDAGDDPDVTHGALVVADVLLDGRPGVRVQGGEGVARVTRPGLGIEVGSHAINPVPRRNIEAMVAAELEGSGHPGALVTISVPGGEALAASTLNPRLGLVGGISILGTTGIVRPFSTSAWRASVLQAIDVARAAGLSHLVFTTGGRTEAAAMRLLPALPEQAFVQAGDFMGAALRGARRRGVAGATVVAMVGKLLKLAAGLGQTHASQGEVDLALLASLAAEAGAPQPVCQQVRCANTARHALDLCRGERLDRLAALLCLRAAAALAPWAGARLALRAVLIDFDGAPLGAFPPLQQEAT